AGHAHTAGRDDRSKDAQEAGYRTRDHSEVEQLLAGSNRGIAELPVKKLRRDIALIMSKFPTQRGQRGIAFLVAMFALLLLSVIGLGMMYSTNMETAINSNYRDKQASLYASLAGLQEARDRIQPATHNIVAPDDLPTTSAAKVIYIVADAATVRPW